MHTAVLGGSGCLSARGVSLLTASTCHILKSGLCLELKEA